MVSHGCIYLNESLTEHIMLKMQLFLIGVLAERTRARIVIIIIIQVAGIQFAGGGLFAGAQPMNSNLFSTDRILNAPPVMV